MVGLKGLEIPGNQEGGFRFVDKEKEKMEDANGCKYKKEPKYFFTPAVAGMKVVITFTNSDFNLKTNKGNGSSKATLV